MLGSTPRPPLAPPDPADPRSDPDAAALDPAELQLHAYVPAYLNWISNKLSRGASQLYLERFGVGVEVWRLLAELQAKGSTTVQEAHRALGMDKASISRALRAMQASGLIEFARDARDARLRHARATEKGQALHRQMERVALRREAVLLSVLDTEERARLLDMLRRLHDHLPEVERLSA